MEKHTKVRGLGAVPNAKIGSYHWNCPTPCGDHVCSCSPYEYILELRVTPKDIAKFITRIESGTKLKDITGDLDVQTPHEFKANTLYTVNDVMVDK